MSDHYQTLDEYNGWANKPTWDAYVWLRSEETSRRVLQHILTIEQNDNKAANKLKKFVEENNPLKDQGGLYADLMAFVIKYINFADIIVAFREGKHSP